MHSVFHHFLVIILFIVFNKQSVSACTTFANATAVIKIGKSEVIEVLHDCIINNSVEEIVVNTCVENLETGTFKDLANLTDIKMVGVNIENIQPGFIENLPNLKYITITYNLIAEIRKNIFSNLQVTTLDLENNKIHRIQRDAFENLDADILSLNNNSLRSIENGWFKNSTINNLQVTSNKVSWIGKDTFAGIKNLEYLDLFDNGIFCIQDGTFSSLKLRQLDLSENLLTQTNFLFDTNIGYLHIGINMVSYMFLNSSANIQSMTIYPNPWRCECLRKFWTYANVKEIKLMEPPTYINWKDEFPICVVQSMECLQQDGDDETRSEYFKTLSFARLQYTSIFD